MSHKSITKSEVTKANTLTPQRNTAEAIIWSRHPVIQVGPEATHRLDNAKKGVTLTRQKDQP
jgi:hypothetical protein